MVEIDGRTRLLGLIGNPVRGSLSPKLHNYVIKKLGIHYRYLAFPVEREDLCAAIDGAGALGARGLNVTVPYKVDVLASMDRLSESARNVAAVNTIVFEDGGDLFGDNTDWRGFLKSLEVNGFDPEGRRCLVFGAGGAARGVVYGLMKAGAGKVLVANRTPSAARGLVEDLEKVDGGTELESTGLDGLPSATTLKGYDLFVNATPLGSGELQGKAVWEPDFECSGDQLFYDLIYDPDPTKFLRSAEHRGAKTLGGLDMLILQGLKSLKIWTKQEFDEKSTLNRLRGVLET